MKQDLAPGQRTPVLTRRERRFVERCRVGRLATVDAAGAPHLVPVCFALSGGKVYITVDRKPKRKGGKLKRLDNIAANPAVAVLVDHYEEAWERLAWVMLRGSAEILEAGREHARAQDLLTRRYPQYGKMVLDDLPVIAIRIQTTASWGDLEGGPA